MAEDAGLKITSSHVNPPVREFSQANFNEIKEFWKVAAADHAKLGVKYLIQPMMPKCESHEDAAFICEVFNESGKIVKEAGIPFGYHNHNMEFKRVVKPEDTARTLICNTLIRSGCFLRYSTGSFWPITVQYTSISKNTREGSVSFKNKS